jgi:hypothetical protein
MITCRVDLVSGGPTPIKTNEEAGAIKKEPSLNKAVSINSNEGESLRLANGIENKGNHHM